MLSTLVIRPFSDAAPIVVSRDEPAVDPPPEYVAPDPAPQTTTTAPGPRVDTASNNTTSMELFVTAAVAVAAAAVALAIGSHVRSKVRQLFNVSSDF